MFNILVTILILMATHVHAQSVEVNSKVFIVEIADTEEERRKGLMFREALCEECGMLFVFDHPQKYGFWMKNVKIPLDIIFINRKFEIITIYEAPIESGFFYKQYWSKGFCKYVIECNIGFCKKNKITNGTKIKIK